MFSEKPSTPGRSAQMPRTTTSTWTPARDARYSASITCSSTSAFIFSRIRPPPSSRCAAISRSTRSMMPGANAVRGDQKIAVGNLARIAGQRIEEVRQVGPDLGGCREQTDVLVQSRGLSVVIASPDVAIAPDGRTLAAHHQAGLAVRLESDVSVDHVHARLLKGSRPADVGLLVEARLDLHHCDYLFAGLGGGDEGPNDRRVTGCAVQRLLDRQHVGVGGGLLDESLHAGGERFVRMMK